MHLLVPVLAAAAGFAAAWLYLSALLAYVRDTASRGRRPAFGFILGAARVFAVAAVVAGAFSFGPASGAAALLGFVAGRAVLTGRFAASLGQAGPPGSGPGAAPGTAPEDGSSSGML